MNKKSSWDLQDTLPDTSFPTSPQTHGNKASKLEAGKGSGLRKVTLSLKSGETASLVCAYPSTVNPTKITYKMKPAGELGSMMDMCYKIDLPSLYAFDLEDISNSCSGKHRCSLKFDGRECFASAEVVYVCATPKGATATH